MVVRAIRSVRTSSKAAIIDVVGRPDEARTARPVAAHFGDAVSMPASKAKGRCLVAAPEDRMGPQEFLPGHCAMMDRRAVRGAKPERATELTDLSSVAIAKGADGQTSYNRLRDLIRADIVEGRLPAGARLKIGEIAKHHGSSAIPVREALQQLQGEGVVVFTPNRGARVRPIDEAFLRNIHEIRAVLEPYLIRWFVRHRTDAQLEALEAAQRGYDASAATEGPQEWRVHNRLFHAICYDNHYNDEALAIAKRHNDLLHTLARRFPMSRTRVIQVCREHWSLIEMIRVQNEDAAAAILTEHVRNAGRHLIERIMAAQRADAAPSGNRQDARDSVAGTP